MRTFDRYEETVTRSKLTGIFCDRCGVKISTENHWEVNDFQLERITGFRYPEGGSGEIWEIEDLCDPCIDALLVLLKTWGATIKEKEWEA